MESLSRPPQRRKHSTATNAFPLKNPYDDVFVPRGGRGKPLEAHEYTEIFAGSSSSPPSIPVLDLSGLDERVGSFDYRVSVQDYSSIFGGLRNDDVAVPYEELFGGSAKRAKPRKSVEIHSPFQHSKLEEIRSPLQHSGSSHPSESTKRPTSEASDQSVEGGKQQINVSFTKTNQRSNDAPDEKMHVAELHSVPGFAYSVDKTPQQQKTEDLKPVQQKTEDRKPVPHFLKREVSRTWSFSADVEDVKGKRGLSSNRPHIPDMPHHSGDANLKSDSSKKPPSSSSPVKTSAAKDPKQSRASNFASKEEASKKSTVNHTPPFLDEEFDENSDAAASAAALKKAIEQAQESIRMAKMIMEKKKEGHLDRYKTRSSDGGKDLDKETKFDRDAYASNENNPRKECEEESGTAVWTDDKCIPSFSQNDTVTKARNVGIVWEKVEAAEGCGEEFARVAKSVTSSCSKSEEIYIGEKAELEKNEKNVGAAKEHVGEFARGLELFTSNSSQNEGIRLGEKVQLGKNGGNVELTKEHGEEFATRGESFASDYRKGEKICVGEKVQLKMNGENVEAAKGHGEELARESKLVVSDCSRSEEICDGEKVQLANVESTETARETADFTGLATFAEDRTANLGSGDVVNNDYLMCSMNPLASNPVTMETCSEILGQGDVAVSHTELVELAEKEVGLSHRVQDPVNTVEETEQSAVTSDHVKASEDIVEPVERVLDTPQSTTQENAVDGDAENKISLEDEVAWKSENNMDEHGRKSEECDKMHNGEHSAVIESGQSAFIYFSGETSHMIGNEFLEQQVMGKEAENVSRCKETGHSDERTFDEEENGMRQEDHLLFESQEPPNEALKEVSERESSVFAEMGEAEKKIDESEIDKDWSPANERDESKLCQELDQDEFEERHNSASEHEAAESLMVEANSFAEVQKNEAFWDVEKRNSTLGETGRSVEDLNLCDFKEVGYDDDTDEVVDANTFGSPVFSEAQETCKIDSNSEAGQKTVNSNVNNGTVPEVTEAEIDEDVEAEHLFHQETDELPGVDCMYRSASEGTLLEGKEQNPFEGLSSDGKTENVVIHDSDSKENLPEDEHAFKPADEMYGADQCSAATSYGEILPDVVQSNSGKLEFNLTDANPVQEQTSESDEGSGSTFSLDNIDRFLAHESEGDAENVKDETSSKEEMADEPALSKCIEEQGGLCSQPQSEPKEDKFVEAERTGEKSSNVEKEEDLVGTSVMGDKEAEKVVEDTERQQRIEAIKRAREQEKDRLAVERAIREARERAFAEARERAARAAAEKAASEARQSRTTDTHKKLDKAPVVKKSSDKASTEAKLRAERAAVERATAEARERALEKALSQKTPTEPRTMADRNSGLKHSFSSSDLENTTYTESAQRRKARLERHQRIMERAAKALAEKNMRDILAQKEQAERNRLAETLDAEIKRWASGKEGNLRALLSTLQYILGRDSGWQPISLTEIVTTAAVKKAYRKATLYVHPDKLQQRGASIQQKYICEKVFDLLKAAWNKFNSEER